MAEPHAHSHEIFAFIYIYIYIYISLKFCLVANNTLGDKNFQPLVGWEIFISI